MEKTFCRGNHVSKMSSTINLFQSYQSNCTCNSSLNNLASNIKLMYTLLTDLFGELTPDMVEDIQRRIMQGKYTLSSPKIVVSFREGEEPKKVSDHSFKEIGHMRQHLFRMKVKGSYVYGSVIPIPADNLVLTALANMLNTQIVSLDLLNLSSFGIKSHPWDYYGHIYQREGPISKIYKIDMTNSIAVIDKEILLSKLKHVVKNADIFKLIKSLLYLPIYLDDEDITHIFDNSIPFSGYISDALLNFHLIDLDNQFPFLFPSSFFYYRYIHEVIITTTEEEEEDSKDALEEAFIHLRVWGKIISIGPGDTPIHCYHGGTVWISEEGRIQMQINAA